jgi:PAP2 superfamily C-terminal
LSLRLFYLALTAFFGAVVLLGHYHYSIDVLAALFITHGVFQLSCWLFARDYALLRSSESVASPRPRKTLRQRARKWVRGRREPDLAAARVAGEPFALHVVEEPAVQAASRAR